MYPIQGYLNLYYDKPDPFSVPRVVMDINIRINIRAKSGRVSSPLSFFVSVDKDFLVYDRTIPGMGCGEMGQWKWLCLELLSDLFLYHNTGPNCKDREAVECGQEKDLRISCFSYILVLYPWIGKEEYCPTFHKKFSHYQVGRSSCDRFFLFAWYSCVILYRITDS